MSLENKIDSLISALISERITDRRKSAESLKELLAGTGLNELLTRNYQRESGISWKKLFVTVHDLNIKESGKFSSGRGAAEDKVKASCSSLLISIVSGANKSECYIHHEKIIECCLEILRSSQYSKFCGETYVNVLIKHVLAVDYYKEYFTPYNWADLVDVAFSICDDSSSIDRLLAVRLSLQVLKNGITRCHLVLPVRENMPAFTKLLTAEGIDRQHHLQENLLEIAIIAVKNVSCESRLSFCMFTETVLPHVFKFYDHTSDTHRQKKKLLFELLHLCVGLHHPQGHFWGSGGCLAGSLPSWSQTRLSIYQLVAAEAAFLSQAIKKNAHQFSQNSIQICPQFVALAVEICHQVFKQGLDLQSGIDLTEEIPPKRLKMDSSDFSSLPALLQCLPDHFQPWIIILEAYILKYGSSLSKDEKSLILDVLHSVMTCNDVSIHSSAAAYTAINSLIKQISPDEWASNENYNKICIQIWNICIRKVSITNVAFEESHSIIQTLLHTAMFDAPIKNLIKIFSEGNVPHSYKSLLTLNAVLSKHNSAISVAEKTQITQWVLKCYKSFCAKDIMPKILFQLCIKENILLGKKNLAACDTVLQSMFDTFECIILLSDFEAGLLVDPEIDIDLKTQESHFHASLENHVFEIVIEFLNSNIEEKNITMKEGGRKILENVINDCDIVLRFLSLYLDFKVSENEQVDVLRSSVKEAFLFINDLLPKYLTDRSEASERKLSLLRDLNCLYKVDHYNIDVSLMIRDNTSKEMVETLCNLAVAANLDDSMPLDELDSFPVNAEVKKPENLIRKAKMDIALNFCCAESEFKSEILEYLVNNDLYDITNKQDFDTALNVLEFIFKNIQTDLPIGLMFQLIQTMCRKYFRNNDATSKILNLLHVALEPLLKYGTLVNRENYEKMLEGYLQRCHTHYYEPKVVGLALTCFTKLRALSDANNWESRFDDLILRGLTSNIHSIRLYSCYAVACIMKEASEEKFKELIALLPEVFKVDTADLTPCVVSDEGANRAATVLHCLAAIAVSSPIWQKAALSAIIQISHNKNINPTLSTKVFKCIISVFNIQSVLKFLTGNSIILFGLWFEQDLPIENFPFYLIGCETNDDFYYQHRKHLIPLEMFWMHNGLKSLLLERVCFIKHMSCQEVYADCLSFALAISLPYVVIDNITNQNESWRPSQSEKSKGRNVFKTISSKLSQEGMQVHVKNNAVDIFKELLNKVCDQDEMHQDFGWNLNFPSIDVVQISKNIFDHILKYIKETMNIDLIYLISSENPSGLQEILLSLWANMDLQLNLQAKLLNMHRYWIFCHLLNTDSKLGAFSCSFIISSLLHVIKQYKKNNKYYLMSVASCKMLLSILQKFALTQSPIISQHLSSIVYTISQAAMQNPLLSECCLELLNAVLVENEWNLDAAIQALDPLPSLECFQELNTVVLKHSTQESETLLIYIERFLEGGLSGRVEGLKLLCHKLKTCKDSLMSMVESLKLCRGFAEKLTPLHQLMSALIQIMADNDDIESSIEACRCLGELGVSDLQTLVLQPPVPTEAVIGQTPAQYTSFTALQCLKTLVYNEDPDVVAAAAKALTSLFKCKEGVLALDLSNDKNGLLKKTMAPFLTAGKSFPTAKLKISKSVFENNVTGKDIWEELGSKEHSRWIVDITSRLLKCFTETNGFLKDLIEVCQLKNEVAEKIFPSIVGLIYFSGEKSQILEVKNQIQSFFNSYFTHTYAHTKDVACLSTNHSGNSKASTRQSERTVKEMSKSVACVLEVVQFFNLQKKHYSSDHAHSVCVQFDYLPISWAACSIGDHFTAIYCAELWCQMADVKAPSNPEKISLLPNGDHVLSILRKSYLSIGDSDALGGCGSAHLLNPLERRNHYLRKGSCFDAILLDDLALSNYSISDYTTNIESNYSGTLLQAGLYHQAKVSMKDNACYNSMDNLYECFWRLGDWSLPVDSESLKNCSNNRVTVLPSDKMKSINHWPAYQYMCLKNCLTGNINADLKRSVHNILNDARKYLRVMCNEAKSESCETTYGLLSKLQILQELEYLLEGKATRVTYMQAHVVSEQKCNPFSDLVSSWSSKNILPFSDFKHIEPILAQRVVILQNIVGRETNINMKRSIMSLQLQYAELAMSNGQTQVAARWTNAASQMVRQIERQTEESEESQRIAELVMLTEGRVAWSCGHHDVALGLVKTLLTNDQVDGTLYANALMQYGSWMMETCSKDAMDIIENYLKKSLEVSRHGVDSNDAYNAIAKYTDKEYKQRNEYIKSPAFADKIRCMEKCSEAATTLQRKRNKNKASFTLDDMKCLANNEGQKKIDEDEILNSQSERERYLQMAMRYYLLTLCSGEENNLCVFRVVSLWMDNPGLELEDSDRSLSLFLEEIPSRKFLPLIPQLAPRLKPNTDAFQDKLHKLVVKCIVEHPYHVLPILISLKNANTDLGEGSNSTVDTYITTAKKILSSIKDPEIAAIIQQTDTLSLLMIKLAYLEPTPNVLEQLIPKSHPIRSMKPLPRALVPTVTLPVRHDCNYSQIPSVISFSQKYCLVGGINNPKKIKCLGSDGVERSLLVKGKDDIRQDAVMQQVFEIVNNLLATNQQTKRRKLLIRTYKVVALSRRSGVIEWCEGTESLGNLLIGSQGYHSRLRPQDMGWKTAREQMSAALPKQHQFKLQVFTQILSKLRPAFHHFFLENFQVPAVWYEKKLAYTHSVATTSMIGYILGLGDRHVQNILIDKTTAEVIHIDFGIAFEQGRVLRTPETIPFRLTQDIIAGFGCSGIEGVFRRSCEKTMDVLKANYETLITILEVFLYDPLYMWTLSAEQVSKKQDLLVEPLPTEGTASISGGVKSGSEAERALLRVKNKLEGVEFGSRLATPGQVTQLLQQAMDVENLARLWPGWQPYL